MKDETAEYNEAKLISIIAYCQLKYGIQFSQDRYDQNVFYCDMKNSALADEVEVFLDELRLCSTGAGGFVTQNGPSTKAVFRIPWQYKFRDRVRNSLESLRKLDTDFIPLLIPDFFDTYEDERERMDKECKPELRLIERVEESLASQSFDSKIIDIVRGYFTIFSPSKEYRDEPKLVECIRESLASRPAVIIDIVLDYYRFFPFPKNNKTTASSTNQGTMALKYSQSG